MSFKTDFKSVSGLGSAKEVGSHWMSQRLTAIALLPLSLAFIYPFASNIGAGGGGREAVIATYQHPFHALVAIGFFIVVFRHLRLGMQVVIEDYVHGSRARTLSLIMNGFMWRACAVAGVFAVARLALGN